MLAKKLYEDAHKDKEIFVIDSRSASGGESQLALLAMELEEQGLTFEEIKKQLTNRRDKLRTIVLYDNISALYKNVKFSKIKDAIKSAANFKSFFMGDSELEDKYFKDICLKQNLTQLADSIANALKGASKQTRVIITHCNNLVGAEKLRDMLMEKTGLSNFVIMSTSGSSSMIACEGGMVVTF